LKTLDLIKDIAQDMRLMRSKIKIAALR